MSNLVYEDQRRHNGAMRDEWPTDLAPARRCGFDGTVFGVPLALVALGLGALAWYYLGPDPRRYLKLRSL